MISASAIVFVTGAPSALLASAAKLKLESETVGELELRSAHEARVALLHVIEEEVIVLGRTHGDFDRFAAILDGHDDGLSCFGQPIKVP